MLTSRMGIGGAESHIFTLCLELRRLGHEIIVASAGGVYESMLESAGVRHVSLPLDRRDGVSLSLAYTGLSRIIEKFTPDIVHSHSRIPSLLCDRYKREKNGSLRVITTAHMPFYTNAALTHLSRWGERTIAISEDVRDYLIREYSLPHDQIEVVENGVVIPDSERRAIDRAITRGTLGIPADALAILSVSRSSESRSAIPLYLCAEAERILRPREYLILCISGSVGDERDVTRELRRQARRVNSALGRRAVILVEGKSDVSPFLSASDIFIGVSRAAMEAMTHKVPTVIAGNEGIGGIFCAESAARYTRANLTGRGESASITALPDMIDALRDDKTRERAAEFCYEYATGHFDSRVMAERTERIYRESARPHVLLVGYYDAQNTGDDASLSILEERLGAEYSVYHISNDKRRRSTYAIPRTDIKRINDQIKASDAVIFGTGNLIQDETSVRSCAYYYSIFKAARAHGKRTAIFSCGYGPIRQKSTLAMARDMLGHADYVSIREPHSLEAVRKLTGRGDITLGADIVLTDSELSCREKANTKVIRGYYVICPRGGQAREDTESLAVFIRKAAGIGLEPILIPMDRRHDVEICRTLAHGKYKILDAISAREIIETMRSGCFCICARLHGAVLAAMADVPYVCYDADGRIGAFSSYSHSGAALCSGEFDADVLYDAITSETKRHNARPYAERLGEMREYARADIRALIKFLKQEKDKTTLT